MENMEVKLIAQVTVTDKKVWEIFHNIYVYGGTTSEFISFMSEEWEENRDPELSVSVGLIDHIEKLREVEEEFSTIRSRFDLGSFPHYNNNADYNWMEFYTLETAQMVYKRYRKDIQTFSYRDEYQQLILY